MLSWNRTQYSSIAKTNLKMLWNQSLHLLFYPKYCTIYCNIPSNIAIRFFWQYPLLMWNQLNSVLPVWSCLVCWTVNLLVTERQRGWGSYWQCMRMSWICPCTPTSACSTNRDSSQKILAASQRDFKMHQQVCLCRSCRVKSNLSGFWDLA